MGKIIMVVGTPGAGKSTVLAEVSKSYKVMNMGTEMLKMAAEEYGISDRDEIRVYHSKHIDKEKALRTKILKKISQEGNHTILDTQMSVRVGNRFTPGFNMVDIETLKGLEAIVYIDALASEIIARREKDTTRHRNTEDDEDIRNQREINLSLISTYAAILGIPIYIIKNNDGKLKSAVKQAEDIAKEVFG